MSSYALAAGIRSLRDRLALHCCHDDSDEQLLQAFLNGNDESAFAAVVQRHGPMVLQVCRRVLGHQQDAEDAFQATFLVLARSAALVQNRAALAGFLHGTAYRIAMKAKQAAARRRKHEGQAPNRQPPDPTDELSWREVRTLLDEEIANLPEKYRSVFVLCCLEGVSREAASRRLHLKEGTVSSRLTTARKRLHQQLARRGVELSAVLAATGLGAGAASAVPTALSVKTIAAALAVAAGEFSSKIASASVAQLVSAATPVAFWSKGKGLAVLFFTLSLLLGAGAWSYQTLATTLASPREAEPPAIATSQADKREGMTVTGRVLDPEGKPVTEACLYWPRIPKPAPKSDADIEIPQRARADAEGRFEFILPQSDLKPELPLALLAAADGYGVGWVRLPANKEHADVTVRLVKDLPIQGRLLSAEGKALAGISVSPLTVITPPENKVDAFLSAWQREWETALNQGTSQVFLPLEKILKRTTTDAEGRFQIAGAGGERVVALLVHGPGLAQTQVYVVNRPGFDAGPVNKAVLDRMPSATRQLRETPLLYGPTFTYVASANRRIEGTVREAGTGKPVPGYRISTNVGYGLSVQAVSDKEGRYHLDNVPKSREHLLLAEPPVGSSWLPAGARCANAAGVQPLLADFTVARGVLVTGQVLDRSTGKGVRGGIRFVPLPGNRFVEQPGFSSYQVDRTMRQVGQDGRFKLVLPPGAGVLMVQAWGTIEKANGHQPLNPYKLAQFDAKDRERVQVVNEGADDAHFKAVDGSIEFLGTENVVKVIDLSSEASATQWDLYVERGLTQTVRIEDADGKPLKGTTVAGVTASWPKTFAIGESACQVFALDPHRPRQLVFLHRQRGLGGTLTLRGDEKEPVVAKLRPLGTVSGRLLDGDGNPVSGVEIALHPQNSIGEELYRFALLNDRRPVVTDKEGRFRADFAVPGLKFFLGMQQGRTYFQAEPRLGLKEVKAGETLDLGNLRAKPGQ
jgi:RNA polymerase sigma factor (sigma-70 family)